MAYINDKLTLVERFVKSGIIGYDVGYSVNQAANMRIVVENVNAGNSIIVQGKTEDQVEWINIGTVNGETSNGYNIMNYDVIRFNCITRDANTIDSKIIVSTFVYK